MPVYSLKIVENGEDEIYAQETLYKNDLLVKDDQQPEEQGSEKLYLPITTAKTHMEWKLIGDGHLQQVGLIGLSFEMLGLYHFRYIFNIVETS